MSMLSCQEAEATGHVDAGQFVYSQHLEHATWDTEEQDFDIYSDDTLPDMPTAPAAACVSTRLNATSFMSAAPRDEENHVNAADATGRDEGDECEEVPRHGTAHRGSPKWAVRRQNIGILRVLPGVNMQSLT